MAVNTLCEAFRRLTTSTNKNLIRRCYSTRLVNTQQSTSFYLPYNSGVMGHVKSPETRIKFAPRTLNIDLGIPAIDGIVRNIIEVPFKKIPTMEEPKSRVPVIEDLPVSDKTLELPTNEGIHEKLARSMVLIRRSKMKKHKRKKLRKKMQFEWAKVRHKRNVKKEKAFQNELIAMVDKVHEFNAKEYVTNRLAELDKEVLPKTWRGEILPANMIRQFIKEKEERKAKRVMPRLTLD